MIRMILQGIASRLRVNAAMTRSVLSAGKIKWRVIRTINVAVMTCVNTYLDLTYFLALRTDAFEVTPPNCCG